MDKKFKKAIAEVKRVREADEKKYREEKLDKWFRNLGIISKVKIANELWDDAELEEKKIIHDHFESRPDFYWLLLDNNI